MNTATHIWFTRYVLMDLQDEMALKPTDKYYNLFNSMHEGFCLIELMYDENGEPWNFKYIEVNPAFKKHTGVEINYNKTVWGNTPNGTTEFIEIYANVVRTGNPAMLTYFAETRKRWFELCASRFGTPEMNQVAILFTDVSERKIAEIALRRSEEKYRTLFNSIDEGFVIQELIYDETGKPIDVRLVEGNPAHERLTGMKNAVGKTSSELGVVPENYWFEKYDHVVKTGEPLRFENWHSPTQHWYDVFISRVGEAGSTRLAMVFNDITERKGREQQQEYLLRLNDALRPLADPVEIQQVAMKILGEQLKADRVAYATVEGEYVTVHDNYVSEGTEKVLGNIPMAAFGKSVQLLTKGENVVIHDLSLANYDESEKQAFYSAGAHAILVIPLVKEGQFVVNVSINYKKPRHWKEFEIIIAEETAERTWAAVERAKSERALRENEDRQTFLLSLSDAMRQLQNPVDIQNVAMKLLSEKLHVERAGYYVMDTDEDGTQ